MSASSIIDLATEQVRLSRQRAEVESEADKIAAKLDNAELMARATPEVVRENRERP